MKAVHINPFLESTINLFETMLGSPPSVGVKSLLTNFHSHRWDVSGVIGVTGSAEGIVSLRLTHNLVQKLLEKSGIKSENLQDFDDYVTSMVGEMANVIAGNAVSEISMYNLDITVPIVVQGKNHTISWPSKSPVLVIPFVSSYGPFEVNVSLKQNSALNTA